MKTKLFLIAALSLCICAASTAQTLPAYLPTDGLVGWWPFNGNANDESGNEQHLNQNGSVEFTQDRWGNSNSSGYFTGNGYLHLENAQLPIGNQNRTASFWVNQDSTILEHCVFSQHRIDACFNYFSFRLNGPPAAALLFDGGCSACAWGSTYNSLDTWVNYTLVYENTYVTLYKNGVPLNTADDPYFLLDNPLTTQENFAIAYWGKPSDPHYFLGAIDDFGFWDRALSPTEVNALYTGEPVNPPTACNPLSTSLQNGLVGYWPFCGNANDESGNGNDGTVNGATLTEDRFGVANAAYDFDGVDDFIEVIDNLSLRPSNSLSISCWILINSSEVDPFEGLVHKQHSTAQNYSSYGLITGNSGLDSSGYPGMVIRTTTNYDWTGHGGAGILDNWINIVGAWDGSVMKFYYNGQLFKIKSRTGNIVYNNESLFFGRRRNGIGNNTFLSGSLDDIGIWNRALTPEEVQQLYTLNACTFTIYDTTNVTIYDTVSVSVSTTDTLIINTLITAVEPAQENTFLVYPNPASTQITINNGNVAILGGYTMRISNSLGQDVYNQNITQPQVTLDLSTWGGNGLYVLYIVDPQQNIVAVKQIVLQ
jgi:hypothetical protein